MNRIQLLRDTIPTLFTNPGSLLYIGISQLRCDCLQELYDAEHTITALEVFQCNINHYRYDKRIVDLVHGDVRDIDRILPVTFDTIFWWHGPEHIQKHELSLVLAKLEFLTNNLIVLSGPWGKSKHGPSYNNQHEAHLWSLYPDDFTSLGYKVVTGGKQHTQNRSSLIAWKQLIL